MPPSLRWWLISCLQSQAGTRQEVAGVKSAPLNVILVLIAFVLGVFFDRLILS